MGMSIGSMEYENENIETHTVQCIRKCGIFI